jgi:hypothetical protein
VSEPITAPHTTSIDRRRSTLSLDPAGGWAGLSAFDHEAIDADDRVGLEPLGGDVAVKARPLRGSVAGAK